MKTDNWYDTLSSAKIRAKENGRGYAYAIEYPTGHCIVSDTKPTLRDRKMRVIECDEDGRETLA